MTENDRDQNDRIRLLKVIQKRMIFVRKIMIVNEIVSVVLSPSIVLYTPKTVYVPLLSTQIFLLFLRESWQNISRNSSFSPFHSAFYPSYFCLLRRWKVPSEPLFLAFKSIFRSLRSRSLSVIKVFQSLKSPLRFAMKIAFAKKGGLWVKIKLFFGKV